MVWITKRTLEMTMARKYNVISDAGWTNNMKIGVVSLNTNRAGISGWVYTPYYQAGRSRKAWETPEAALKGRVKNYRLEECAGKA